MYDRIKLLGEGVYGKAYLVQHKETNNLAVIKQIDISSMNEDEKRACHREAKILQVLDHPNITKYYDAYKTKTGSLHIIMEYADDNDLESKIKEK